MLASAWCVKMQPVLDTAKAGPSPFVFTDATMDAYMEQQDFTALVNGLGDASNCWPRDVHIREDIRPRFPEGRPGQAVPVL